jgi:hypothetical protein
MQDLLTAVKQILAGEDDTITIRHLFYRLVGLSVIAKDEGQYHLLCSHLARWRRSGEVAWSAFADPTRGYYGDQLFTDVNESLQNAVACYRKNLWMNQGSYVEVWTEKDAIASAVCNAVSDFGVRVYVCRGFSSLTGLYSAADQFRRQQQRGKEAIILHLGDHDPSGLAIDRHVERSLREDFGLKEICTCRLAVTPEQIAEYSLPTRPVKATDTRAAGWRGGCVEVDSMPMPALRSLLRRKIEGLIDPRQWEATKLIEAAEHESYEEFAKGWKAP